MGKIATLNEAMQIAGSSEATTTQICATKKDAVDVGCKVAGTYAEQQLVQKDDLSKAVEKVNVKYSIIPTGIPVGTIVRYSLEYISTTGHTVRRNGATSGNPVAGTFECNKGEKYNLSDKSFSSYGDLQATASFVAESTTVIDCYLGY